MKHKGTNKACLIGLGLITQRYIQGFEETSFLELCGVSDVNENAIGRPLYNQYPFYLDYKQMLWEMQPDYAIISTPPETHFEIALHCLQNGVNIIIEKPVTLCMEHFDTLAELAKEKNLVFRTLFHWRGGIETNAFTQTYDLSKIQQIKVAVCDPYCADGERINTDRRPLMGAWIDSGVNTLSMIRMWLPFEKVEILATETQRCGETNLPIYAKADLLIDGVKTQIAVDWRQGRDCKESFVEIDGRWVHVDHSNQCIYDNRVTDYARMPRLDEHYRYLFGALAEGSNIALSRSVHEVLFKVSEVL